MITIKSNAYRILRISTVPKAYPYFFVTYRSAKLTVGPRFPTVFSSSSTSVYCYIFGGGGRHWVVNMIIDIFLVKNVDPKSL